MQIRDSSIRWYLFMNWSNLENKFRIPDYQRPYVRDESRIEDFFNDLLNSNNLPFLGSFIFQKAEDWFLDIVDWQQRVMSITIVLSVLRNIAKELWEDVLATNIQQRMTKTDNFWKSSNFFIKCREETQDFVEEFLLHEDWNLKNHNSRILKKNVSERNIKNNYNALYEIIMEKTEWLSIRQKAEFIDHILNKLDKYQIVYIQVDNDEEAYTAFEIVNARWQELGNIDLLKNLFFKYAASDWNKKSMVEKRDKITANIDNCNAVKVNLESFLKHFWHARFGKSQAISWKMIYWSFKTEILKSSLGYDIFSDEMLEDAILYNNLTNPETSKYIFSDNFKYNEQIKNYLYSIKSFQITQAYVLLLTIFRYRNIIGDRIVRNIVWQIEIFHFAYSAISKLQGNKLEKLYWRYAEEFIVATKIEEEKDRTRAINAVYDQFRKRLYEILPSKAEFTEKFIELKYKNNNKPLLRYILSEYEQIKKGWHWETYPDFTNTNIEHIFPVTNYDDIDDDIINNIGNLMLLSIVLNSKCGNKPLEQKIPIYAESDFIMVKDVVNKIKENKTRSEENITERAKEMWESLYNNIMSNFE